MTNRHHKRLLIADTFTRNGVFARVEPVGRIVWDWDSAGIRKYDDPAGSISGRFVELKTDPR